MMCLVLPPQLHSRSPRAQSPFHLCFAHVSPSAFRPRRAPPPQHPAIPPAGRRRYFFDGTAMVLVDLRIEELAEMRLEPFVRALVGSHQPRTTRDVGRQDRCKTAGRGHGSSNPPCSGLFNAPLYRRPACFKHPHKPGGAHYSTGAASRERPFSTCAVTRRRFPVGARPTRRYRSRRKQPGQAWR